MTPPSGIADKSSDYRSPALWDANTRLQPAASLISYNSVQDSAQHDSKSTAFELASGAPLTLAAGLPHWRVYSLFAPSPKQAAQKKKNPISVYDLYKDAKNDKPFAVYKLAEAAETDPYAVTLLTYLSGRGNEGAKHLLKQLNVTELTRQAKSDEGAADALGQLVRAGNPHAIDGLVEAAKTNPTAVLEIKHYVPEEKAKLLLKELDVTVLGERAQRFNDGIIYVGKNPTVQATRALKVLVDFGNEAAFGALAEAAKTHRSEAVPVLMTLAVKENPQALNALLVAAKTNPEAVMAIHTLAKDKHAPARTVLKRVDVSTLADRAKSNPESVFLLRDLAAAGNKGAQDLLKRLDVANFSLQVKLGYSWQASIALIALADAGNESARKSVQNVDIGTWTKSTFWDSELPLILSDCARLGHRGAFKALTQLDTSRPVVAIALAKLARSGHKGAKNFVRRIDLTRLAARADSVQSGYRMFYFHTGHVPFARRAQFFAQGPAVSLLASSRAQRDFHQYSRGRYFRPRRTISDQRGSRHSIFWSDSRFDASAALGHLAKAGHQDAVSKLAVASRSDRESLYVLGDLTQSGDVRAFWTLAREAKKNPKAIRVLSDLATGGHKRAAAVLRRFDVRGFGIKPGAQEGNYKALAKLAKHGNKAAFSILTRAANKLDDKAISALDRLARTGHLPAKKVLINFDVTKILTSKWKGYGKIWALKLLIRAGNKKAADKQVQDAVLKELKDDPFIQHFSPFDSKTLIMARPSDFDPTDKKTVDSSLHLLGDEKIVPLDSFDFGSLYHPRDK